MSNSFLLSDIVETISPKVVSETIPILDAVSSELLYDPQGCKYRLGDHITYLVDRYYYVTEKDVEQTYEQNVKKFKLETDDASYVNIVSGVLDEVLRMGDKERATRLIENVITSLYKKTERKLIAKLEASRDNFPIILPYFTKDSTVHNVSERSFLRNELGTENHYLADQPSFLPETAYLIKHEQHTIPSSSSVNVDHIIFVSNYFKQRGVNKVEGVLPPESFRALVNSVTVTLDAPKREYVDILNVRVYSSAYFDRKASEEHRWPGMQSAVGLLEKAEDNVISLSGVRVYPGIDLGPFFDGNGAYNPLTPVSAGAQQMIDVGFTVIGRSLPCLLSCSYKLNEDNLFSRNRRIMGEINLTNLDVQLDTLSTDKNERKREINGSAPGKLITAEVTIRDDEDFKKFKAIRDAHPHTDENLFAIAQLPFAPYLRNSGVAFVNRTPGQQNVITQYADFSGAGCMGRIGYGYFWAKEAIQMKNIVPSPLKMSSSKVYNKGGIGFRYNAQADLKKMSNYYSFYNYVGFGLDNQYIAKLPIIYYE